MLADLVKFCPHQRLAAYRSKVFPVHYLGHMMGSDGTPVSDSGGAVLVTAGVTAVRIALGVSDEDGHIAVIDIFVHQHRIAPVCGA